MELPSIMHYLKIICLSAWVPLIIMSPVKSEEIYKWVDENGIIHFTDSPMAIPPEYRDQVETRTHEPPPSVAMEKEEAGQARKDKGEFSTEQKKSSPKIEKHEVPFEAYEGRTRRIIVRATLNGRVTVPMLFDTGASSTVISWDLAQRLGLFSRDRVKLFDFAQGIGGTVPAIKTIVDRVQVGDLRQRFVPATVTHRLSDAFEGLLGMDFMSGYSIRIDNADRKIIFDRIPTDSEMKGGHTRSWWENMFHEFSSLRSAWKAFGKEVEKRIWRSRSTGGSEFEKLQRLKKFADFQIKGSNRLFETLDSYAARNAVPKKWRRY